jgi:hypothetical protein
VDTRTKKMNQIIKRATFHLVARCPIFFFIHVSDVYTIDRKKRLIFRHATQS